MLMCVTCFVIAQSGATQTTHQVEKGETLYSISRKYQVTVEAIEKANKSVGGDFKLKIGQTLVIPISSGKASSTAKPSKPATETVKSTTPNTSTVKASVKQEPKTSAHTGASSRSVHIVEKGETVYSLARSNGLTVKQLKDANQLSDDLKLKLGQKLIIPVKNEDAMYKTDAKEPTATEPVVKAKPVPVKPTTTEQGKDYLTSQPPVIKKEPVKSQETIEQIKPIATKAAPEPTKTQEPVRAQEPAKVVKTPEQEHDENPFEVPKKEPTKAAPAEVMRNTNVAPNDYSAAFSKDADSGKKKAIYRGIGTFMQSENPGNQFLALYNYADMGSILRVTNLMSKETIYVKVIGKVPTTDTQKDVILKVSSDAAAKLKVSEEKFLVEVTGFNAP